MQVIAQDLEQAQTTADQLKYMLDERDAILHGEVQSKNMNNQMISKLLITSSQEMKIIDLIICFDTILRMYSISVFYLHCMFSL